MGDNYFDGRVRRIPTQTFEDRRGRLSPIGFDFGDGGFRPLRAFIVEGQLGAVRGCHGHATTRQVLMLVSGLVEVELRWGGAKCAALPRPGGARHPDRAPGLVEPDLPRPELSDRRVL